MVSHPDPAPSPIGRALDFATDWGVLAFAAWTPIAYLGMLTDARVSLLVPVWLATVPLAAALLVWLGRKRNRAAPRDVVVSSPHEPTLTPLRRRQLLIASVAGGLTSAILAAAAPGVPWPIIWAPAFVAVGAAVWAGRLHSSGPAEPRGAPGWNADVFAALVSLGLATTSLFIRDPNADDVFYVNRATATAQLNRIPVRDVILTNEQVPPVSGAGLPVDTFHALQGGLARLVGVEAPSVAYYVTPPLFTFLATWALWRLLRQWAPRSAVLCFGLGCVYWIWSAQSDLTPGYYFLTRMWQGKVVFVGWLVLTTFVYLTRWLGRREALTAVLLIAAGVGSIGLTGSATFVTPLILSTAAIPLLARRDWRGLPVLIAAAVFPFVVGVAVTRRFPLAETFAEGLRDNAFYYHSIVGVGLVAALGAIGLWVAPWLVRPGPPTQITCGIGIVTALLLAPGVFALLNELAGLTSTLRRTLWVIPLPALVGLLAAVPAAQLLRAAGATASDGRVLARPAGAFPAIVVAGLLVAFGSPLWLSHLGGSNTGAAAWTSRPTWKTSPEALGRARAILDRYDGKGPVLARQPIMRAIALVTVSPKAVNPRRYYTRLIPEPRQRTMQRLALTRLVMGWRPRPSPREIRRALSDLRVGLVCLDESDVDLIRQVEDVGPYTEAFRVGGQVCLERHA